jgi:hypothetical protein
MGEYRMNKKLSVIAILLSLAVASFVPIPRPKAAASTTLSLQPATITFPSGIHVGATFNVTLYVSSVTNLWSWKVAINWDPTILSMISAPKEGSFMGSGTLFLAAATNNTGGNLPEVSDTLLSATGKSGSGNLATFTFEIMGLPANKNPSVISISNAIMLDPSNPHNPIAFTTANAAIAHDVVATGITAQEGKTIVGSGLILPINVTVTDVGSYAETFNVTVYANGSAIGQQQTAIPITSGSSEIIQFSWNTNGWNKGNYTISATVAFDATNTFTAPAQIEVTIIGDVLGKHQVNILDVVAITSIYGVKQAQPRWNPNCDIENIGQITILDVVACTSHYGQKWT